MNNNLEYVLKKSNNNIDLIRLLCAVMVIYGHIPVFIAYDKHYDIISNLFPFTYCGNMAVLTFFFISGLLVGNSLFSKKNILDYILSRFFRIYPALIVVLILSCIFSFKYSNTSLHRYFHCAWMYFYNNIIMNFSASIDTVSYMTQNYPLNGQYANVTNGSLWTIPIEIKMYWLLLALYLIAIITGKLKNFIMPFILTIGILSPYIFSHQLLGGNNRETLYLIPIFCLGALFAYFKDKIILDIKIPIAFFILYEVLITHPISQIFGIICFVTFLLYLSSLKCVTKIKLKHDISYGLYLYGWIISQLIHSYFPTINYYVFIIIMTTTTILSLLSAILIEEPGMKLKEIINQKLSTFMENVCKQ